MGFFFTILKWIVIFLVGVIAIALTAPHVLVVGDKIGLNQRAAWLEEHSAYRGPADGTAGFSFPDEFYENRLFLFGEVHGYAAPQEFDLALLKHLNERAGVRFYLAEMDPAQATVVNHFLETGDDARVRAIFDAWAETDAQWANKEFFAKLQALRALNNTLADNRQIGFIGIDAPQSADLFSAFSDQIDELDGSHPAQRVNAALIAAAKTRDSEARYVHMIQNIDIAMAMDELDGEKLYGLWGVFHVLEVSVNETGKPLALRLQSKPAFEDGIASLYSVYGRGSQSMMPGAFMPGPIQGPNGEDYVIVPASSDQPYLFYARGIHDLQSAADGVAVSVFAVDGDQSPYGDGDRFVSAFGVMTLMQPFDVNGAPSAATDYIVYFEGSPSLTPWNGTAHRFVEED